MTEHRASVVGSLGATAEAPLEDGQSASVQPTLRRLWLRMVYSVALAFVVFPVEAVPSWRDHGLSLGAVLWTVATIFWAIEAYRALGAIRRRGALDASS